MANDGIQFSHPQVKLQTGPLNLKPEPKVLMPEVAADTTNSASEAPNSLTSYHSMVLDKPLQFDASHQLTTSRTSNLGLGIAMPSIDLPVFEQATSKLPSFETVTSDRQLEITTTASRDIDLLRDSLTGISPELGNLFSSSESNGKPVLDQNLNYTLTQVLVSFDPNLEEQAKSLIDRCIGSTPPNKQELALLASLNLSWKDGKLFDHVKNQSVGNQEQAQVLKINLGYRRFQAFQDALISVMPGKTLTPVQQDLLTNYGLFANKKGELINLIDKSPVTVLQRNAISNVLRALDRNDSNERDINGFSNRMQFNHFMNGDLSLQPKIAAPGPMSMAIAHSRLVERLGQLAPVLRSQLERSTELQQRVEDNRRRLETRTDELAAQDQANSQIAQRVTQAEQEQSDLAQEGQDLEVVTEWLTNIGPGVSLEQGLQQTPPAQAQTIQAAMIRLNLVHRHADGRLTFQSDGKPLTRDSLRQELSSHNINHQYRLRQLESQIQGLRQQLQVGLDRSRRLREEITLLQKEQDGETAQLGANSRLIGASREELLKIKNDPASWNQLTADQQREIDALLNASEQTLQNESATLGRAHQTRTRSESVVAQSLEQEPLYQDVLQKIDRLLSNLNTLIRQTNKLEQSLSVREKAHRLIEKANQLQKQLSLTPKPLHQGADRLMQEWEDLLKETANSFNKLNDQGLAKDSLNQTIEEAYAHKMKENIEYHLLKLDQGKQYVNAQLKNWLDSRLTEFRQQLEPDSN